MFARYILSHCVHKIKPYRQFSSSSSIISKNLYKSSLPILSTPWLMLPPDVKDGPNGPTDNYWNIIDKSIVKIDRSMIARGSFPFNTKCVGSAKGWLAFDCDSDGSLFLANPYNIEASSHKLPPPCGDGIYRSGLDFTLAGDPLSNNFQVIMEDRQASGHGVQIGNQNGWRKKLGPVNSISPVAYNRKSNTVYELQLEKSGKLHIMLWYALRTGKYGRKPRVNVLSSFIDTKVIDKYEQLNRHHSVEKYLVVSEEDNPSLFFVIRHLAKDEAVQCETKDIELYKIDLEGNGELEHVESIGDKALFLGRNSEPFFISTRECSGIKSNCVYVADDLGYYDLETKCITPFLSLGDLVNIRPYVYWVAPSSFT